LKPERIRELEWRQGLALFEAALGHAMADGVLEPSEVQTLNQIAAGLNTTTRALMLQCFAEKGEGLLRSAFAAAMQAEAFTPDDWQRLVGTAAGLGLTEGELRQAVRPQAQVYVEHVLADVKMDGRVSDAEQQSLQWLLTTFGLDAEFCSYVWGEIQKVQTFARIAEGRLPAVQVQGVALRAGEIAHHQCPAVYVQVKQTKSGTRAVRHDGHATITDTRVIFSSPTKSFDLNLRRVVSLLPLHGGGVEVRAATGGGQYYLQGDAALATAIFNTAVGKANQTIIERLDGASTRHISREVRQRVWQQYGGRCADCGATQYLEFDHIVPVAKGGSNGEANVQLLCRGCNQRKSDSI
jgi:hypothetical protein